jgi:predicted dehydrogenase
LTDAAAPPSTVLVVGGGSIGQRHLRNLASLGAGRLVAVDPDPQRWDALAELGAEVHADLEQGLASKPEVVVVATPPAYHAAALVAALEAGAHVFVEKPLDATHEGAVLAREAAQRHEQVVWVGYQFRFHPAMRRLRELVAGGVIGRPLLLRAEVGQYLPDWRPQHDYRASYNAHRKFGGGIILDASHEIDYSRLLMGEIVAVSAVAEKISSLDIDVEDAALVIARFADGALGEWHLDTIQRAYTRGAKLVGEEGTLVWEWPATVRVYRADVGRWDVEELPFDMNRVYRDEIDAFLRATHGEDGVGASIEEGFRVMEIALAVKRAAAERREIACLA